MVASRMTFVFTVLFSLTLANGAAHKVVRRELDEVVLSPDGDLRQQSRTHHKKEVPEKLVKTNTSIWDQDMAKLAQEECPVEFFKGTENAKACPSQEFNMTQSMCIYAAGRAGAGAHHDDFSITARADQEKRPFGCFKAKCRGSTEACYFFNEIADVSLITGTVEGTPICSKKRYEMGAANSNAEDGGCPTPTSGGYQVIDTERACLDAANCLGDRAAPEDRVGIKNASQHLDHPRGCFYDTVLKEVFYNPLSGLESARDRTKTVQGTPICNVSATIAWA